MNVIVYLVIHLLIIYFLSFSTKVSKVDIFVASAIIIIAISGDSVLKVCKKDIVRGITDSSTHGLIGLFSWCIVALHTKRPFNKYEVLLCGFLASFIDIDHFLIAKSFHIKDALHQKQRPYLHCSTIPLLLLIINIFITRRFKLPYISRCGWILWTSFTSHHIRDANRRGLWFYPFGSTQPLSDAGYILSTIVLPYVTAFMINNFSYYNLASDSRNYTMHTSYFDVV